MAKVRLWTIVAIAALVLNATAASAAIVIVNQTMDLSLGTAPSNDPSLAFFGANAFSSVNVQISEGDTLDWTIRFLPGQSLDLADPQFLYPVLHPDFVGGYMPPGTYLTQLDPAVLQFLGPSDEVLADLIFYPNGISANAIIGLFSETTPGGAGLNGPITISGLRTVLNLGDYVNIPEQTLTFTSAGLTLRDRGHDFGFPPPPAPAPEPTSWALLIIGFGAAGAVLRRSRRGAWQPS